MTCLSLSGFVPRPSASSTAATAPKKAPCHRSQGCPRLVYHPAIGRGSIEGLHEEKPIRVHNLRNVAEHREDELEVVVGENRPAFEDGCVGPCHLAHAVEDESPARLDRRVV